MFGLYVAIPLLTDCGRAHNKSLDKLNTSAVEAGLPIKGLKVYPEVNDSFFVVLSVRISIAHKNV